MLTHRKQIWEMGVSPIYVVLRKKILSKFCFILIHLYVISRKFCKEKDLVYYYYLHSISVEDLRGARGTPLPGPKFLHFHAVFGKNWPNNRLAPPPLGLAPPPLGNPGSATEFSLLRFPKIAQTGWSSWQKRLSTFYHINVQVSMYRAQRQLVTEG